MQQKKLQNVYCKATELFVTIGSTMSKSEKSSEEVRIELGNWLQIQRKSAGLTQENISSEVPMDRVHLARIEKGHIGTKRDTVISIVEAINRKSSTGHQIDSSEALDRYYGKWVEPIVAQKQIEAKRIAERLASGVMASGFDDLQDEDLREDFLADMQTIAESMLRRKLEEQQKRKSK